jgi:hypothetical protein
MNIFPLVADSTDPHGVDWKESAIVQDDLRVVKMTTESCQMLGSCAVQYGMDSSLYHQKCAKHHFKHPSYLWTTASSSNYEALLYHAECLLAECYRRFNRPKGYYKKWEEAMWNYHEWFTLNSYKFPDSIPTKLPLCMGSEPQYINEEDVVGSYQRYYANKPLLRYVRKEIPQFVLDLRETHRPEIITKNVADL